MMPEWHQLDSSCTMSEQQESMKKKTLKSSSRSFLFSTGLLARFQIKLMFLPILMNANVQMTHMKSKHFSDKDVMQGF